MQSTTGGTNSRGWRAKRVLNMRFRSLTKAIPILLLLMAFASLINWRQGITEGGDNSAILATVKGMDTPGFEVRRISSKQYPAGNHERYSFE
jgi:hypothetical protein